MRKKSRQKRKSQRRTPHVSPLEVLRPRFDKLLSDFPFTEKQPHPLKTQLGTICQGVNASDFLPILLRARHHAGEAVQAYLDDVVPQWLSERSDLEALCQLLQRLFARSLTVGATPD